MKNTVFLLFAFISITQIMNASSLIISFESYFQDPARTPKNSKQVDPVNTVDGSSGKYKNQHKHANGKDFATRKRHIKTVKTRKDNGKEKAGSQPSEKKG